jgi:poly(hydroxyalkanoate) granule-associated protein
MVIKKKTDMIPSLKDSAYNVWLAGLGAYTLAGEEGTRLYKELVEKGAELDEANKERLSQLADRAQGLKGEAKDALAKITTPIENGLATAMSRLGVPTREEIVNLTHRVEELTRLVAKSQNAAAAKAKVKAEAVPKRKPRAARA